MFESCPVYKIHGKIETIKRIKLALCLFAVKF